MRKRERINVIPIIDVIKALGIQYDQPHQGADYYNLYEGDKRTDGRKAFISSNRGHDFSGKGRPEGKVFYFVQMFLNLDQEGTYDWFNTHFNF